jgi:hypothetical protein
LSILNNDAGTNFATLNTLLDSSQIQGIFIDTLNSDIKDIDKVLTNLTLIDKNGRYFTEKGIKFYTTKLGKMKIYKMSVNKLGCNQYGFLIYGNQGVKLPWTKKALATILDRKISSDGLGFFQINILPIRHNKQVAVLICYNVLIFEKVMLDKLKAQREKDGKYLDPNGKKHPAEVELREKLSRLINAIEKYIN